MKLFRTCKVIWLQQLAILLSRLSGPRSVQCFFTATARRILPAGASIGRSEPISCYLVSIVIVATSILNWLAARARGVFFSNQNPDRMAALPPPIAAVEAPPAIGGPILDEGASSNLDDFEVLEYEGMEPGTPIYVEGVGTGTYLAFQRKVFGANLHTIDFGPDDGGTQTLTLRERVWRVPGGVPGARRTAAPPVRTHGQLRRGSLGAPSVDAAAATTAAAAASAAPGGAGGMDMGGAAAPVSSGGLEGEDELADMIRLRKPKNFGDGALSALGCVGKGLGAGIAGLVAAPAVGVMEVGPRTAHRALHHVHTLLLRAHTRRPAAAAASTALAAHTSPHSAK
jgi:hypothetical protein